MKKSNIALALITALCTLVIAGGLSACSASQNTTSTTSNTTRTVTDAIGRTVTIPATVKTVAVNGFAARMVVYAGGADKLVGVSDSDKSQAAAMPYALTNYSHFSTLPSVCTGGASNSIYGESLISLSPDVIISTDTDVSASNELQEKTGIPVIVIDQNTLFGDSTYNSLALLGEILGTSAHTNELIAAMKSWQQDLNARTADIPDNEKPTVYAGAVSFKGAHGFEGTYAQFAPFIAINAKNVVDTTGMSGALIVDLEKVATWNPAYIFVNPQNMSLVNQGYAANPDFYNNLQAVQNGNVYSQPAYNSNGTNLELAIADAYYAGKVLYPTQFADIDIDQKADEIFKLFLGTTYIETLNNAGLGFTRLTIGS